MRHREGNMLKWQAYGERSRASPLNPGECDHFYVEAGLPKTRVLLWVYGEQLRAVLDHVVLAEYRCRYDWREHHVKDIRDGVFYPTSFASPQGALIPLTPHESLIVYRSKPTGHVGQRLVPVQQLWLFELVQTA